ncbi:penicillin-binding transpeptidase domain-containing protein [Pengzhenrongella sp.]|jgi:hypothetical protein|uniref:penicillin-binding transpeptidase domain-containing protein n=1 Tax=Pengzhenrongella sp. TaxID=2888820 RepID=UPI002F95821C
MTDPETDQNPVPGEDPTPALDPIAEQHPTSGEVSAAESDPAAGQDAAPRRRRPRKALWIAFACVVVLLAFVAVRAAAADSQRHDASTAATRFLRTWANGDLSALPAQTVSGSAAIAETYKALDLALGITAKTPAAMSAQPTAKSPSSAVPMQVKVGAPSGSGHLITVPATVTVKIPGLGTWIDHLRLSVRVEGSKALVDWSPASINAEIKTGDRVRLTRTVPTRGAILGAGGRPLPAGPDVTALVGTVGPASASEATADPTLRVGDVVGQSGLQAADDAALRGAPSGALTVVDSAGHPGVTLIRWAGTAPKTVSSTIDPTMQTAAAAALAPTGHPSALVAIDARTGAVLAAASTPAGYPRALLGRYPPGSTFKMVTLTAALLAKHTMHDATSCTPTATVDGYAMHNANNEAFGTIPLQQAFAVSCNTSFVHLAMSLPHGTLATAATLLGCNTGHAPLATPSYGCSYPANATGSAYAASAIGQGTVQASPLAIAAIAAAADSGTWNQPHVTPGPAAASHPLPAAVTAGLHAGMRAVVTSGTGTPANLPGTPVYGKTGTAQQGSGANAPTDAWFAAFRGNVAMAVIVEGGGFGEKVAAPVAARFLSAATH